MPSDKRWFEQMAALRIGQSIPVSFPSTDDKDRVWVYVNGINRCRAAWGDPRRVSFTVGPDDIRVIQCQHNDQYRRDEHAEAEWEIIARLSPGEYFMANQPVTMTERRRLRLPCWYCNRINKVEGKPARWSAYTTPSHFVVECYEGSAPTKTPVVPAGAIGGGVL